MPDKAKFRLLDVRPLVHQGRPSLLLRDPLQLSDRILVVSRSLAPVLRLCDGTRDLDEVRAALAAHWNAPVTRERLEEILAALDEAYLLDNERAAEAHACSLAGFRAAPFRPPALAGQSYPADADELRR